MYTIRYIFLLFFIKLSSVFAQHSVCLELDKIEGLESFQALNNDFKNHNLVLLGEAPHNMPANTYLQVEFFIYLNKMVGTKTLLIEFGSSDAYLLNKYLQTGNWKYFNRSFYGFKKLKEAKYAIRKLYEYNKSLNPTEKLKVIGLDFEREPALTSAVHYFLEELDAIPELKLLRQKVKTRFDTVEFDNPKPFLEYLRQETPKYVQWLDQSPEWPQIQELIYFKSSREDFWSRDKYMIERFAKLPSDEHYLGSFGTMHTRLDEEDIFAGMLQNNENYKDNILVINFHYENSKNNENKPIKYSFLNDIGFFKKRNIRKYLAYFSSLNDCDIFISPVNPTDKYFQTLKAKCDYIIFLNYQKGYTIEQ